jgi:putative ABC transport system permease protein
MKRGFYLRLACTGIRKNRQLYLPYLITSVGMVMMFYIVAYLSFSPVLEEMKGGRTMQAVMNFGTYVLGLFAVIFLFYTNSFLVRRRNKEFGLYNILGMNKGNIGRILVWETGIMAAISLSVGLALGILFSKLAELAVAHLLGDVAPYRMTVLATGIRNTVLLFLAIFLLQLLVSLGRVKLSKPLALLRSENTGEKPPKANWVLAVLGLLILAAAYYLAVTVAEPITAMLWFFAAVIMVIIATYLLFIAGSVALCKLLQKNKRFYYHPRHFVSVSNMVYRMKRNGAGLASICILCTMVLVMMSSTSSLYIGGEEALKKLYPMDLEFFVQIIPEDMVADQVEEVVAPWKEIIDKASNGAAEDRLEFVAINTYGMEQSDGTMMLDSSQIDSTMLNYDSVRCVEIISQEDYEKATGETVDLERGEALLYSNGTAYPYDTLTLEGAEPVKVTPISQMPDAITSVFGQEVVTVYTLVVPNLTEFAGWLADQSSFYWYDTFNVNEEGYAPDQELETEYLRWNSELVDWDSTSVSGKITSLAFYAMHQYTEELVGKSAGFGYNSLEDERGDFLESYGSLFFLGVLLSISFLMGTVLIVYYKQVSEGYEDQSRFAIMQKVGMTHREIRRSINSQVLVVFFAPLLLAGLHLSFAFPMIWKMMRFLGNFDWSLLLVVNVVGFLIFGLFYGLVYRVTSEVYYRLVK